MNRRFIKTSDHRVKDGNYEDDRLFYTDKDGNALFVYPYEFGTRRITTIHLVICPNRILYGISTENIGIRI